MSEDIKIIIKGVRQICVLSPLLFSIYWEAIFPEATRDTRSGVIINRMGDLVIISDMQTTLSSLQVTVWNCNE